MVDFPSHRSRDARQATLGPQAQAQAQGREAVGDLLAENAHLRRLLEEDGQSAERGMLLLAQAAQEHDGSVERLRTSLVSLRAFTDALPQLVWGAREGGDWTWSSLQWQRYTGQSEAETCGLGWLDAVHPEDRGRVRAAWNRAAGGRIIGVRHRLRRASDGAYRWFQTRSLRMPDAEGRTTAWSGTSTDIHELHLLQERQSVLLNELQHRVRNTLAVVRLIGRRTGDTSESVEDYAMRLDGRLQAFTRVQAAVPRDPSAGIGLHNLVAEELLIYQARERARISISGPDLWLKPKAAELIGLAIHELMANAVAHGALARPTGSLRVVWEIAPGAGDGWLMLDWMESGVPGVPANPPRVGFGSRLLTSTLTYELDAETKLDFRPDGLHCRIAFPLSGNLGKRRSG